MNKLYNSKSSGNQKRSKTTQQSIQYNISTLSPSQTSQSNYKGIPGLSTLSPKTFMQKNNRLSYAKSPTSLVLTRYFNNRK